MSAAVSHELNQPLAAMKTYLAGAKLLLQRKRMDEALSSFQRIDDLIGRMGAITRQLKSYARKGGDDLVPVDVRAALNGALEIMEPQLKSRQVFVIYIGAERAGHDFREINCGWSRSSSTCCAMHWMPPR